MENKEKIANYETRVITPEALDDFIKNGVNTDASEDMVVAERGSVYKDTQSGDIEFVEE